MASEAQSAISSSVIRTRKLPLGITEESPLGKLKKLANRWRYGWGHPDEDLLLIIDAVGDALRAEVTGLKGILTGERAQRLQKIENDLVATLSQPVPDFATVLGIETRISALYPREIARRRRWIVQERFERVAARGAVAYWLFDPPPSPAKPVDEAQVEQVNNKLREARVAESQAQASHTAATEAVAAADKAVTDATATLTAAGNDPAVLRAELDTMAAADSAAPPPEQMSDDQRAEAAQRAERRVVIEQILAPLKEAETAQQSARERLSKAEIERDATVEALQASKRICAAVEAKRIAEKAGEDLRAKQEALQKIRSELKALAPTDSGYAAAQQRLENAKIEVAAAQDAYDQKTDAAVRLERSAGLGGGQMPPGDGGSDGYGQGDDPPDSPRGSRNADTQALLGYIHNNYLMNISREKSVRDLKRWLHQRFWLTTLLFALVFLMAWPILESAGVEEHAGLLGGLFIIAIVGRIGATMSIVRRLQLVIKDNVLAQDAILELIALRTGRYGIKMALLSGGVFALLLYALFAAGIPSMLGFEDGIFPEVANVRSADEERDDVEEAAINVWEATATLTATNREVEVRQAELSALTAQTPPADAKVIKAKQNELAQAVRRQAQDRDRLRVATADAQAEQAQSDRVETADTKPSLCEVNPTSSQCDAFARLARALRLKDRADLFKLLIWAFIAGFAERFVPDVLDRIVTKSSSRRNEPLSAVRRPNPDNNV